MLKMSKLLAGAIGAAAAIFGSTGALADAKGSVFGDFRYAWTHFDDDVSTEGESDLHDNGSHFGIKASTGSGDVNAFGVYSRVMDTDDCVNVSTGGGSGTSLCQGGTDYTREAYAGVSTPFGSVSYGQLETAYSQAARRHDPFYNTGVSGVLGVGAFPGTGGSHGGSALSLPLPGRAFVNNQFNYASPNLFGATVNVAYFSSEDSGATEDPDFGIGAGYTIAGVKLDVQHLRLRSGFSSTTPNFLIGAGDELDATVLAVGYAANRFGVGITAERIDDRTGGAPDADSFQLGGWFGVVQGTRVALAGGMTNEGLGNEGRSGTLGVFHDVTENFTAHVAATMLEGDADNGTPDAEAYTLGASYKFDLGFSAR